MSLAEMQSCLARLYTDFTFQQLFFLDPSISLEEYQLSPAELQTLSGLNQTRLKRFALSLMNKSRDKFEVYYPLLFKATWPHIKRYYPRFYHLFRSLNEEALLLEFARFMEQTLRADPQLPPYLSELARYERQLITAELKADLNLVISGKSHPPNFLDICPALAPGVTFMQYQYNIAALAQLIRQDQKIDQPEAGSFIFLVYLPPGKIQPQILEINRATTNLIEYCSGELVVGEIIGKLEQTLRQSGLQEIVIQNLEKLFKLGVLNA